MPMVRSVASLIGVVTLSACGRVKPVTDPGADVGCGLGGYASQPPVVRRAALPAPSLVGAKEAGLRVVAYDADNGAPIGNLRLHLSSHADSVTRQTSAHGVAIFAPVAAGPVLLDARLFNFLPWRDSIALRAGFMDTLELRMGRMGKECFIVPERAGAEGGRA
jgi:hypothetical protein